MAGSKPKVRAILFDADGVVQRNTLGWIDRVRELCGRVEDTETFLHELFAAERPCLLGRADFKNVLAQILHKWSSTSSASDALSLWTQIEPEAAVLDLINTFRRSGTQVALASNQQEYRAAYMLDNLGYAQQFDHILFSCNLGFAKPSMEFFEKSIEHVRIAADQLLFIDDSIKNVQSAKLAGLHAEQFHLADGVAKLERTLRDYRFTTK